MVLVLAASSGEARGAVNIGIVVDGPRGPGIDTARVVLQSEVTPLIHGAVDVRFPEGKALTADGTAAGARAVLEQLLSDDEVDMVVAAGMMASHFASTRGALPKPVIAPFVINAAVQGIPRLGPASGVPNLSYITFATDPAYGLKAFHDVVAFTRVAILYDGEIEEACPAMREYYEDKVREMGAEPLLVPVDGAAEDIVAEILDALPPEADAVSVGISLKMSDEELSGLSQGLIERRLPSFSVQGTSQVRAGLLAGLHLDTDFGRLARRMALNIQRILLGERPESLPTVFERQERLTINMATARAIGVNPSWGVLTEAELLHGGHKEIERQLTLAGAVREAILANLDLAAKTREMDASRQEAREARARLLPQVELGVVGVAVDEDLASPAQAEQSVAGSASLTQILYSEPARAGLAIQRLVRRSRELEREQVRLDIAAEAAKAYLNLLRAQAFEGVQKQNLKLTRANLELSLVRQQIGVSGPAELYRWESQIATARNGVIQANSQRNLAELALNRVLHRPLEEPFQIEEIGLYDDDLITSDPRFVGFMVSKRNFGLFRAFMVEEGLSAAPELGTLDAIIEAQERTVDAAQRVRWQPSVALRGDLNASLAREGAGSEAPAPGGDAYWTIGVSANLPVFRGGANFAAAAKAQVELEQLRVQRESLAERLEQRIRSALHLAGASYAGIGLSEDAAVAAHKNLELAADAYRRGGVSILEVLDAQTAAILANEGALSAVYGYLIDLMEVERSTSRFHFLATVEEREAWFGRAEDYLKVGIDAEN